MSTTRPWRRRQWIWSLLVGALLAGCAGIEPEPPKGVMDTPGHHYTAGIRLLDSGDPVRAQQEFERAHALDPDYAPALEGLGLVALSRGDLTRAEECLARARRKDSDYVPAYVTTGRVLAAKTDLKGAREAFRAALDRDARHVAAHFYLGQAELKSFEFGRAEASFSRALELDPTFAPARREWERSVKIRMASPGTVVGRKIALADPISRADLAALLGTEFGLEDKLRKRRPEVFDASYEPPKGSRLKLSRAPVRASDIDGHWAKNAIELVLRLNLIELFPDQTFRPDAPASRATLAMVLHELLIATRGDERVRTQLVGGASPFPDVRSDHFAFPAVIVTTTTGFMGADPKTGTFRLGDPVSGPDTLLGLRKLAELF